MITDLPKSVFKCHHSDKHLLEFRVFTYKMAAEIHCHRYGTQIRQCHPMYKKVAYTRLQSV